MKRTAIALILVLAVLQCSDADARSRLKTNTEEGAMNEYVFFYGGANSPPNADITFAGFPEFELHLDNGLVFGGGVGTQWHNFRLEGEVGYRSNDVSTEDLAGLAEWDFSAISLMVNVYYDLDIGLPVIPFGGVGGGFAQVRSFANDGINSPKDNATVPAYQFMAGAIFDFSDRFSIFGAYRYFRTTKATINELFLPPFQSFEIEFVSQEITAGIFFRF